MKKRTRSPGSKTGKAPEAGTPAYQELEEELLGTQRNLRAVIAHAPILLFAVDKNGIFTLLEGQALANLGWKPSEIMGRSIYDLYRGHPQIPSNILRVLKKGEAFSSTVEISGLVFDTRYMPIKKSDAVVGAIGIATDVTSHWRAQQERDLLLSRERIARAEADAANRAKDEFLAVLSHELRTPMTAMIGWTWMLRSKPMDEEHFSRALTVIERNMKVQAQIIEDLLDISSLRSGKLRLQSRIVELGPIVAGSINILRPVADGKSIQIVANIQPAAGTILGDPERLNQIFWNLLANAIKFTPEGGNVHVDLRRVGDNIEVAVSDTGEGIRADFIPYLFGLFQRAEASITRKHRGLGLGLAIVWDLVELHGGTVRAFSEGVGKGSTFTVILPTAAPTSAVTSAEEEVREPASALQISRDKLEALPMLDSVKVLIVNDEADIRETLVTILENYGAIAVAVGSCAEALEAVPRLKPHVLISDIVMPVEDGYTLIRKLRTLGSERGGDTPAIALTAYAQAEDRTRTFLAGFNLYVQKPVEPAELAAAIANLAGRTRSKGQ